MQQIVKRIPDLVKTAIGIGVLLLAVLAVAGPSRSVASAAGETPTATNVPFTSGRAIMGTGACFAPYYGVDFTASNATINGGMHSNGDMRVQSGTQQGITVNGGASAVGAVYSNPFTTFDSVVNGAAPISVPPLWNMADFAPGSALVNIALGLGTYHFFNGTATSWSDFGVLANTNPPSGIYYASSGITFGASDFSGITALDGVTLVSPGVITLDTGSTPYNISAYDLPPQYDAQAGTTRLPVIFSTAGAQFCGSNDYGIHLTGAVVLTGAAYAPNGVINISTSSSQTMTGSLIGFTVSMAASNMTINFDPTYLPGPIPTPTPTPSDTPLPPTLTPTPTDTPVPPSVTPTASDTPIPTDTPTPTPLAAPILISPKNGAQLHTATPTFTWNAVDGAAAYGISVATDPAFTNQVDGQFGGSETTWTTFVQLEPGIYYWHVAALNADFTLGAFSETRSFRIHLPQPPSPQANCAQTSSNHYDSAGVDQYDLDDPVREASTNADKNLTYRGLNAGDPREPLALVDEGPPSDSVMPPQLATLFSPNRVPAFTSVLKVNDWNWEPSPLPGTSNGAVGNMAVSAVTISPSGSFEPLHSPKHGRDLGKPVGQGGAVVLYADANNITLKFTREDSVATGYTIQISGICVDPKLLALYVSLNNTDRNSFGPGSGNTPRDGVFDYSLPGLEQGQVFGTSLFTNDMVVTIRDSGTFLDPRSIEEWWQIRPH